MGGEQRRINVLALGPGGPDVTGRKEAADFANFDAGRAQCFRSADRQKLLAIIESAFGDTQHFNCVVRQLLTTKEVPPQLARV